MLLILVHLVAMGIVTTLQIRAEQQTMHLAIVSNHELASPPNSLGFRFTIYRWLIRLATLSAMMGLATWLAGLWST